MVGAVVILAIIGATGLIIQMQRLASIAAFRIATVNLGNGMSQQTARALGSVDQALKEIGAGLTASPDATADGIAAAMRLKATFDSLMDQRKRLSGINALLVVDADGVTAAGSRGFPAVASDIAGTDVFVHFKAADDPLAFVGEPVKDPTSGRWTSVMARRINDAHGSFAGLVAAEISLTDLQEFYHLAMPARRSVYVLRRDGVVLVRYPQRDTEIGRKIPDASPWYGVVVRGGGTFDASAYFDQTPIIAAVQSLRNLPFVVQTEVTEADALSDWRQQRIMVVLGSIAAAICALVLIKLFATQYRRLERSEQTLASKNAELDVAHEQLNVTLANLVQGVCLFDRENRVVVFNPRYCEIYKLPPGEIQPGMSLEELCRRRIAAGTFIDKPVEEYLASVEAHYRAGDAHDAITKLMDGRTISSHRQPLPGRGWVVTYEDITARCEADAKIAFLARHDVLTGLANRSLFQDRLEQALALAERGKGFAVLCLDLDRFKAVNDTLGHPVGDSLLRAVAGRLRDVVRESDTVARLGGDEFAILQLGVTEVAETTVVARRIVQSISEPYYLDGHEVSVGTSIGIAMAPGDSAHPVQLMKNADLALYRSKQEGRGTWRFFERSMDAVATTRRALEVDLRRALAAGQFELHYQPIVSARTRRVTGFEALLRWRHPKRGLLLPGEFISIAEEIGLISDIGAWILLQACLEAMSWPDHLRIGVNLSTRQFRGNTLVTTVGNAMQTSGLAPDRLELEITESVPLANDQGALAMLQDLHRLGARIALDDFGSGYSSLSYLRGFSFDTIKIDRCFVSGLNAQDESGAIVRAIIGLAASLRMSVTAEGVETEDQFAFLAAAGCTEIQGYLISRPVPAHEVPALIESLSGKQPEVVALAATVSA